jgi:serine/threonine protein kinase
MTYLTSESDTSDLQIETVFAGRYTLLEKIEQHERVVTFKAREAASGELRALRQLRLPASLSALERQERLTLFETEAQILALLENLYLLRFHEFISDADHPVIVTDYPEGRDIRSFVRTDGPSIRLLLQLFDQLADALEYIHAHGIIHCDLRPQNILITSYGLLKLHNFERARIEGMEMSAAQKRLPSPLAYQAPERIQDPFNTHLQVDLYGLGIVMYELLTGQLPFRAEGGPDQMRQMILTQPPIPPVQLRPELGEDLSMLIMSCLHKNPEHRLIHCRQFRQLLKVVLDKEFPEQSPDGPPSRSYLPVIQGFENFGLVQNLAQLITGKNTGQCLIWNSRQEATLWLEQGQILHADIKNMHMPPLAAFFSLCRWQSGSLLFLSRQAPHSIPAEMPQGAELIQQTEAMLKKHRELWARYQENDCPRVTAQPTADELANMPEQTVSLLDLIDGQHSVAQIAAQVYFDRGTLFEAFKRLEDLQLLSFERQR